MIANLEAGFLALQNPKGGDPLFFEGKLFGRILTADQILASVQEKDTERDKGYGEIVFNTSMTGYQEILTDPSYYGQIICMTYPHIGNTGINSEDIESRRLWCGGFVVHELTIDPSNWRSEGTLQDYLEKNSIPAITGIDTRRVTRTIRDQGALKAVIIKASEKDRAAALLKELPDFEGRDLIKEVSAPEAYLFASKSEKKFRVVALDFGIKTNLLRLLAERGCEIEVMPANTSAEKILERNPDGVFLSNGPGDPAEAQYAVSTVKSLLGKKPIFGVCMGHQILSLALGAKTFKMKFGHHGANQPVFSNETKQVEISSQNHGFAVKEGELPAGATVSHFNLNDQTVEGISYPEKKAFSVQYHPEASPGPRDSVVLFNQFIEQLGT